MSDTKFTQGEWAVGRRGLDVICNGATILESPRTPNTRSKAGAERAVLCHNCHDDLVSALKYCRNSFERYDNEAGYDYHSVEIAKINAALAKAGEK